MPHHPQLLLPHPLLHLNRINSISSNNRRTTVSIVVTTIVTTIGGITTITTHHNSNSRDSSFRTGDHHPTGLLLSALGCIHSMHHGTHFRQEYRTVDCWALDHTTTYPLKLMQLKSITRFSQLVI